MDTLGLLQPQPTVNKSGSHLQADRGRMAVTLILPTGKYGLEISCCPHFSPASSPGKLQCQRQCQPRPDLGCVPKTLDPDPVEVCSFP